MFSFIEVALSTTNTNLVPRVAGSAAALPSAGLASPVDGTHAVTAAGLTAPVGVVVPRVRSALLAHVALGVRRADALAGDGVAHLARRGAHLALCQKCRNN